MSIALARMRVEPVCPQCGSGLVFDAEEDPAPNAVLIVECDRCDWTGVSYISVPQPREDLLE